MNNNNFENKEYLLEQEKIKLDYEQTMLDLKRSILMKQQLDHRIARSLNMIEFIQDNVETLDPKSIKNLLNHIVDILNGVSYCGGKND